MKPLDRAAATPLYQQVRDALARDIAQGGLCPGSKLPSIRKLAVELGISRNTVEAAYQALVQDGLVEARPASGYYVL